MTKHAKTNFRRLFQKCGMRTNEYEWMGDTLVVSPLHDSYDDTNCYRLKFKHDVIDFHLDLKSETIVPLHITNVIEDIDKSTMVTGTKIPKRNTMILADERLFSICQKSIVLFGRRVES